MKQINTFYRNKPSGYFQEIEEKYDNIMYPYRKDRNGDRYCPANERIRGLFFNGRREKKKGQGLPKYFLFGDTRVIVPAFLILNSDSSLYFCDFWCHRDEHHVTVVVTRARSETDIFCQEFLLSLDRGCNGYLELDDRTGHVSINQNTWVEVFFTESVDLLAEGVKWEHGHCHGVSRPDGMPKPDHCDVCNFRVR